jgi:hypothetical protein
MKVMRDGEVGFVGFPTFRGERADEASAASPAAGGASPAGARPTLKCWRLKGETDGGGASTQRRSAS